MPEGGHCSPFELSAKGDLLIMLNMTLIGVNHSHTDCRGMQHSRPIIVIASEPGPIYHNTQRYQWWSPFGWFQPCRPAGTAPTKPNTPAVQVRWPDRRRRALFAQSPFFRRRPQVTDVPGTSRPWHAVRHHTLTTDVGGQRGVGQVDGATKTQLSASPAAHMAAGGTRERRQAVTIVWQPVVRRCYRKWLSKSRFRCEFTPDRYTRCHDSDSVCDRYCVWLTCGWLSETVPLKR